MRRQRKYTSGLSLKSWNSPLTNEIGMFIFLDTETTGTGLDDRLCQIAFKPEDGLAVCELFNPGMPISIDAMAVHHITNKMVQEYPNRGFTNQSESNNLGRLDRLMRYCIQAPPVVYEKNELVPHRAYKSD